MALDELSQHMLVQYERDDQPPRKLSDAVLLYLLMLRLPTGSSVT